MRLLRQPIRAKLQARQVLQVLHYLYAPTYGYNVSFTANTKLKEGDKIKLLLCWATDRPLAPVPSFDGIRFTINWGFFGVIYSGSNYGIDFARNLPDITLLDLLQDLAKIFNFRFLVSNNTVFINTFDDSFLIPSLSRVDLSDYVSEDDMTKYDIAPNRDQIYSFVQDSADTNDTTDKYVESIIRPYNAGTSNNFAINNFAKTNFTYQYVRRRKYIDSATNIEKTAEILIELPFIANETWKDIPDKLYDNQDQWLSDVPGRSYNCMPRFYLFDTIRRNQHNTDANFSAFRLRYYDNANPGVDFGRAFVELDSYPALSLLPSLSDLVKKYWGRYLNLMRTSSFIRVNAMLPLGVFRQLESGCLIRIRSVDYMLINAQGFDTGKSISQVLLTLLKI